MAVEAGRQLLLSADAQAEALLQEELTELQEQWRSASIRLDRRKKELLSLLKVLIDIYSSTWSRLWAGFKL